MKVIQATSSLVPNGASWTYLLTVVCDDGSMWHKIGNEKWVEIRDVPYRREPDMGPK